MAPAPASNEPPHKMVVTSSEPAPVAKSEPPAPAPPVQAPAATPPHNDLYDRSTTMRWLSYGSATLGVGLLGVATYRVMRGSKEEQSSPVAIVPLRDGSMISWSGRF